MASRIFKPPTPTEISGNPSVFLAGTIDNGNSLDWQAEIASRLKDTDVDLYNPRREEWDKSWEQSISNPVFKGQVDWELDHLDKCDVVFMYFAGGSQSPITLLELGLYASTRADSLIIVCSPDFWRKGNVEVVADRFGIPLYYELDEALVELKQLLAPIPL